MAIERPQGAERENAHVNEAWDGEKNEHALQCGRKPHKLNEVHNCVC